MPLGLLLTVLVTRALFVYGGGMPEPDSVVMAAGMAKGMRPEVGLGDATLYGRQLSPAMYAFVDTVYPWFFDTPRHIVAFLNWIAVMVTSLAVLPMVAILRDHMDDHAVAGTVLIAAFTPVVWEWGTYFHPLAPAVLLLLLALAAARRGGGWSVVAVALGACAMVVRVEVLFVVPAIVLWAVVAPRRRARNVTVAFAGVVVAAASYVLVLRALPQARESDTHGLRSYATMIFHMYVTTFSLPGLTRSVAWAVLGMGLASMVAAGYGIARYLTSLRDAAGRQWSGRHALVIAAVVWVLPTLMFWLPQPTPILRHYVLAALGIAWLAGYLVLQALAPRRAAVVVVVVIATNLLVPEIAYRVYNARHPGGEKSPHGAFFYQQQVARGTIARHAAMATQVVNAAETGGGVAVLVDWVGYSYILHELYAHDHRVERLAFERENPNVSQERFRVGANELRVVEGIRLQPGSTPAGVARAYLDEALRAGMRVFVPSESAGAGFTGTELGGDAVVY